MSRASIQISIIILAQSLFSCANQSNTNNLDREVASAIQLSEEALYDARLYEAKALIHPSQFQNFHRLPPKNKIQLAIQDIRVDGFVGIVYRKPPDRAEHFERLESHLSDADVLMDKNVQGDYYLALSSVYRSIGKRDSAGLFEGQALNIFEDLKEFGKVAQIRANRISRIQNQFLADDKREDILQLIPKFKKEIEFATLHSKYALAYNTRHLAQIHRRQTLNYRESIRLFEASLNLREEIRFKPFIPASVSSLGDVYLKMGEHDLCIEMYLKSAELAEEIGFIRYESYPIMSIGDLYLSEGDIAKAKEYYTSALSIATENSYQAGIKEAQAKLEQLKS